MFNDQRDQILVSDISAQALRSGRFYIRPSGTVALTIYSPADLQDVPVHYILQLMEITGFLHPKQALVERPDLCPICSLL